MTLGEIETEIRNLLGYDSSKTSAAIVSAVVNAQKYLERKPEFAWFLSTVEASLSTVADTATVSLASDFISEVTEHPLYFVDTTLTPNAKRPLRKLALLELRENTLSRVIDENPTTGKPIAYALQGTTIHLDPTPDAVYTLKLFYRAADTTLVNSSDTNNWTDLAPWLLIGRAGYIICLGTRDKEGQSVFSNILAEAGRDMAIESIAREQTNQRIQAGGDD